MRKIFLALSAFLGCLALNAGSRNIPVPVFDAKPEYVDLYWTAWEQARAHIKYQPGLVQPRYMDEGFRDDAIWIWDSEFMVMFCKYAPKEFPGIQTLDNFYYTLHENAGSPISVQHPDNPPFFAWVESDYFKFTDDTAHIRKLLCEKRFLQKHFDFFNTIDHDTQFSFPISRDGVRIKYKGTGYNWNRWQSGMDNTPRMRGMPMFWIDAISQQALSALYIARLARVAGDSATEEEFRARYEDLKAKVNQYYWDAEDGCYYDIREDDLSKTHILTPASFWPMLAEIPSQAQAKAMVDFALKDDKLGGAVPWTSVARDDEQFDPDGNYWRGSLWLPTAYMGIKALEKYGFFEEANTTSEAILEHMWRTYAEYEPHTIWECYNPSRPEPSSKKTGSGSAVKAVKGDFCGWSALGPISLFIENVLGFYEVDAASATVRWNLHQSCRHGIRKLTFGAIKTDILYDKGVVRVKSNKPYTLFINGNPYAIRRGRTVIRPAEKLLVATFNVRFLDDNRPDYDYKFGGQPWPVRRSAVKAFYARNDLDLVGLQEVRRTQFKDLVEDFGKDWAIYCPGRYSGDAPMVRSSDEAVGLMYRKARFRELGHGCFYLSDDPAQTASTHLGQHSPIVVSWAHLEEKACPGKKLWFFSAHISWSVKENPKLPDEEVEILLTQMEKLTGIRRQDFRTSTTPVFLVGDLNNVVEESSIQTLLGIFNDARTTCPETESTSLKTFHSFGKSKSAALIDYIFYTAGKPEAYLVDTKVYDPEVKFISDHYPVLFRLSY